MLAAHHSEDLDIAEYTDAVNNPMIPDVIVLEPGLAIHKIYNGDLVGRPTMEESARTGASVSRKCGRTGTSQTPD